jgi:hypothetical protein
VPNQHWSVIAWQSLTERKEETDRYRHHYGFWAILSNDICAKIITRLAYQRSTCSLLTGDDQPLDNPIPPGEGRTWDPSVYSIVQKTPSRSSRIPTTITSTKALESTVSRPYCPIAPSRTLLSKRANQQKPLKAPVSRPKRTPYWLFDRLPYPFQTLPWYVRQPQPQGGLVKKIWMVTTQTPYKPFTWSCKRHIPSEPRTACTATHRCPTLDHRERSPTNQPSPNSLLHSTIAK